MPNLKKPRCTAMLGCLLVLLSTCPAFAQDSRGFKFNNLTVSPYVNLEYTYDSNVDYDPSGNEVDDMILRVNPGVDLSYQGDMWGLKGNAWYSYEWYKDSDNLSDDSYGESLEFYRESAKGWRFMLGQSYTRSTENDSLTDGGRGLWRDREQMDWQTALSYELSEKTAVTLSGMYSDLSYVNDGNQYQPLYGWEEWSLGLELARRLTEKSNLLLSGSYQQYTSDGATKIDDSSTGYTLQGGFGSRATERIKYRLLTGASWFDYADEDMQVGWVYSADASWVINKKWAASLSGSSQFQPSEQDQNQAIQAYMLSAGLTYKPAERLSARFDVAFRREEDQFDNATSGAASTDDRYSIRLRGDYRLRRFVTLYGGVEYEDQMSDSGADEFDRYRATLGLNFRY